MLRKVLLGSVGMITVYSPFPNCCHFAHRVYLIIFYLVSTILSHGFQMGGRLYEERIDGRDKVSKTISSEFAVSVSNCDWLVEVLMPGRPGFPDKREVSFINNGQIRSLFFPNADGFQPKLMTNNGVVKTQAIPQMHVQATVTSNDVLVACNEGEVFISHLWLMFASGCYLKGKAGQEITPIYDINACASFYKQLTQKAQWALTETEPPMPAFVAYMNTRGVFAGKSTNGTLKYLPLRPPYNQGFTNAFYFVTGWTNVDNLVLPTGFSYQRFEPMHPGKSKNDLRVVARGFAIVTNFSTRNLRINLDPYLPAKSVVVDRRLRDAEPAINTVTYSGSKGLATPEQARKIHARQERRRMFERLPKWLVPAVVILAIIPTVVVVGNWGRKKLIRGKKHDAS